MPPEERAEEVEGGGNDPRAPYYDLNVYEVGKWVLLGKRFFGGGGD